MDQKIIDLCHRMNEIPHLNITPYLPKVPIEEMLEELNQFTDEDFYPYITGNTNKELAAHMAANWHGFCIIDSCKEGRHNVDYLTTENNFNKLTFNIDENGQPVYRATDVGELMPATVSYLNSIVGYPQKTRISRIMPNGGNASWHSHYKLALTGDKKFAMNDNARLENKIVEPVLHIPLRTNPDVWFGISASNPNYDKNFKAHWKRYNVGEVWIFNSFFHHNVFNKGTQPRDHIMMYIPFNDPILMPILEKAINDYTGFKLPMDTFSL